LNKLLIYKYINNITKDDILYYSKNKLNYNLEESELDIIYLYIKRYYKEVLSGNYIDVLDNLRDKIRPQTYNIILELLDKYKNFINLH
jgi:hypothetical protein